MVIKLNIKKYKKNQKLVSESIAHNEKMFQEKYNDNYKAEFDGYAIHSSLLSWALNYIPTKQLKEYIEQNKLNKEDI